MNTYCEHSPTRTAPDSTNCFNVRRRAALRTRAPLTCRRIDEDRLVADWFLPNRMI